MRIELTCEALEDAGESGSFMPQLKGNTRVSERIHVAMDGAAHKPATHHVTVLK